MSFRSELHTRRGLKPTLYAWVGLCLPLPSIGAALLDPLIACSQLTDDTARLACFDKEAAELRKHNSPSPTSPVPTPEQQFGLSEKQVIGLESKPDQAPAPKALHVHIVSVSQSALARQVFVTDNAQTWQQIELDPDFRANIGQEVTISKGALGSFWLATDSHHATRVKRVR
jgi:hypothetical protein